MEKKKKEIEMKCDCFAEMTFMILQLKNNDDEK